MIRILFFAFGLSFVPISQGWAESPSTEVALPANTVAYLSFNNQQHILSDMIILQQYLEYILPQLESMEKSMRHLADDTPRPLLEAKVKTMEQLVSKTNAQLNALNIQSHEVYDAIQLLKQSNNLGLRVAQEALKVPINLKKINQMMSKANRVQTLMSKQLKQLRDQMR